MMLNLAGSSQSDLRRQIQYLKAENQILRGKIEGPVRLTKRERARLVKLGKPLGDAIKTLVSIVKSDTFMKEGHGVSTGAFQEEGESQSTNIQQPASHALMKSKRS